MKKIIFLNFMIFLSIISFGQLPEPGFKFDKSTAIVITDPQNDFLSEKGVAWGAVGESVKENGTVENLRKLFELAAQNSILVFVSPHYYYQHDHQWKFEGVLEKLMHNIGMFDRKGPLTTEGFEGSGADWLQPYKKYISGSNVIVTSPHKVYGPQSNDLALQLRKRGIDKVVIAGMSGNLCVESHLRELLEEGFEVAVVSDATASAKLPSLNGAQAALTNYTLLASKVFKTSEFLNEVKGGK
ncbi:MAG: cysteine hydrolase [Sediminibacterium magnilacihabitans]|jgi:nicotinamidase-related amidase|nr:cysteine hydrolase [Sediminibacterium magnilacihabitans]PQV62106.1 nicotinamidase-related amidase [Sediminibacterium magnilacihabitans]